MQPRVRDSCRDDCGESECGRCGRRIAEVRKAGVGEVRDSRETRIAVERR